MSTTQRPANIYLDFLRLVESINHRPALPPLDPLEERILNKVASINRNGCRLSVRDMTAKSELGAHATIHTRLKAMRAKGWITLADTEDGRRKQIELTQAALLHFDKLSKCLLQAMKSEALV